MEEGGGGGGGSLFGTRPCGDVDSFTFPEAAAVRFCAVGDVFLFL